MLKSEFRGGFFCETQRGTSTLAGADWFACGRPFVLREGPKALWPVFEPFVPVWAQIEPGVTMWLDPYDFVSRVILGTGEWEPQTRHVMEPHVPVGGTFVDVGAHIGWYSLKAAKAVGPKGHVIAVEPNHETLLRLRDNIRASGASAVIVVAPVACSDSETTLNFYAAPRANTGESSLSLENASQRKGRSLLLIKCAPAGWMTS